MSTRLDGKEFHRIVSDFGVPLRTSLLVVHPSVGTFFFLKNERPFLSLDLFSAASLNKRGKYKEKERERNMVSDVQ